MVGTPRSFGLTGHLLQGSPLKPSGDKECLFYRWKRMKPLKTPSKNMRQNYLVTREVSNICMRSAWLIEVEWVLLDGVAPVCTSSMLAPTPTLLQRLQ